MSPVQISVGSRLVGAMPVPCKVGTLFVNWFNEADWTARAYVGYFTDQKEAETFARKARKHVRRPRAKVEKLGSQWVVSTAYRHYEILCDVLTDDV